jgi:hypothetical protein
VPDTLLRVVTTDTIKVIRPHNPATRQCRGCIVIHSLGLDMVNVTQRSTQIYTIRERLQSIATTSGLSTGYISC